MIIKTSDQKKIQSYLSTIQFPSSRSHKGQNGKLLIIGGSKLFHAASLWSAAIASRIVDMVHYGSTKENEKIFLNLKTKFVDGIIVNKKNILSYVQEDDCILVGPGMMREKISKKSTPIKWTSKIKSLKFSDILSLKQEPSYTYQLIHYLMSHFPHKKFVFDAGALQMMEKEWLLLLKTPPILTPHQSEFQSLFHIPIVNLSLDEKKSVLKATASQYHSIIHLKNVNDLISDGSSLVEIIGGNAGLTKGGTGDVLAGVISALNTKNTQLLSCISASIILKKSAEDLYVNTHFWYNTSDLVLQIPKTMKNIFQPTLS